MKKDIHGLLMDFFKGSVLLRSMIWLMSGQFLIQRVNGCYIVTSVGLVRVMAIIIAKLLILILVLLLLVQVIIDMDLWYFMMSRLMIFNVLDMLYFEK